MRVVIPSLFIVVMLILSISPHVLAFDANFRVWGSKYNTTEGGFKENSSSSLKKSENFSIITHGMSFRNRIENLSYEITHVPSTPKRREHVYVFAHVVGNFSSIRIRINGTIVVEGVLRDWYFHFGPRLLPMVPIGDHWYISAIPGLPAREIGSFVIKSYVEYKLVIDGNVYDGGEYNVSSENTSFDRAPIVFMSVYDALNDSTIFNETLGLGPHGWRINESETMKVLITVIDDDEPDQASLEYSVSNSSWNQATVTEDKALNRPFEELREELDGILSNISSIVGENLSRTRRPIRFFNGSIPGQNAGNYVVFRANATDLDGKTGNSVNGFYYVVNRTSHTRILVIDPSVTLWVLERNLREDGGQVRIFEEDNYSSIELYGEIQNYAYM